jgi:hypothetical protein
MKSREFLVTGSEWFLTKESKKSFSANGTIEEAQDEPGRSVEQDLISPEKREVKNEITAQDSALRG